MTHYMRLNPEPFRAIQEGYKTIELRLYDEKRQRVQIGDSIQFACIQDPQKTVTKKVVALHRFADFEELFQKLPLLKCGETPFSLPFANAQKMDAYYSREQQKQFQVVGIELEELPLQRFLVGQKGVLPDCSGYEKALSEIRSGYKSTHWMWYVFPQLKGLTPDTVTEYYALINRQEALQFLQHPLLGDRLIQITGELLKLETDDPVSIFGLTDAYKLRSCMTLFTQIAPEPTIFQDVLEKFCLGLQDENTIRILKYDKS